MAQALNPVASSPAFLVISSRPALFQASPSRLEYRHERNPRSLVAGLIILGVLGPVLIWCLWNAIAEFLDDPWSGGSVPGSISLAYVTLLFGAVLLICVCGLIFCAWLGLLMIFGRHGLILDKEARTMILWWQFPFRRMQTVHHLDGFATIHVRKNGRWSPFHAICFTGPPEPELMVTAIRSRKKAEEIVDRIAMFLDWRGLKE